MYTIYLIEKVKNITNNNNNNNNEEKSLENGDKTNHSNINNVLVIGRINLNKSNNNQRYSNKFDFGIEFSNAVKENNDSSLLNEFKKDKFINEYLHPILEFGINFISKIKQKQINSIKFIDKISFQINSHIFDEAKKCEFQLQLSLPLEQDKMNDILNKTNYDKIKIVIIKIAQEHLIKNNCIYHKYLTTTVKRTLDNFRTWCRINNDYSVERKNNKYSFLLHFPVADQQIVCDRLIDNYGEKYKMYLDNISDKIKYFFRKNCELFLCLFIVLIFLNANNKIIKIQSKIEYIDTKNDENEEIINNNFFNMIYQQLFDDNKKYRNILRNSENFTINFIDKIRFMLFNKTGDKIIKYYVNNLVFGDFSLIIIISFIYFMYKYTL